MSRRRCPRDVWLAEVYRTKRVGDRCVRVLLYMGTAVDADGRRLMDERGYFRQHWEDTAKALGITDLRRLSERWTEAVKAGLLVRAAGGRNGQVTMFLAQVTEPQVPGKPVPVGTGKAGTYTESQVPGRQPPTDAGNPVPTAAPEGTAGTGNPGTIRARVTRVTLPVEPTPDASRVSGAAGCGGRSAPRTLRVRLRRTRRRRTRFFFSHRRSPSGARGAGVRGARSPPATQAARAPRSGPRWRSRPGGGVGGGGARPRPVHPKRPELGTCTWHPDQRTGSCGVCMKASADLRKRRPDVFCTQFHPAIRLDDNGHCLGCAYEGRYTPPDVEVTG